MNATRRPAAILAADVAGYSRLIGADEEGTLNRLRSRPVRVSRRLHRKIGFTTGVLILAQRQAVLVAKQAASLHELSDGRLRLGIGVGWNEVEFVGHPSATVIEQHSEKSPIS